MEIIVIGIFAAILLVCLLLGYSILYALVLGYFLFCIYGLINKFTVRQLLEMTWKGVRTVKNILITFLLIGMLTAIWRASGTIPFIIYHVFGLIIPSIFLLIAFLLCCLISTLIGTAFGSAATVGVICMAIGNTMGMNPIFVGGAIMSGIFFGDRCSPMSTSALLVSELTETNIYENIKNMIRTSVVPFIITCGLYFLIGRTQKSGETSVEVLSLFAEHFNLHWVVVLPAVIVVVLCLFKTNVKKAMVISTICGSIIYLIFQDANVLNLLKLLIMGYKSGSPQLAAMIDGGGVVSMLRVTAIICLSSSYAGIFEGTGLLDGIKIYMDRISKKITPFGNLAFTSVLTNLIACNQTLGIILTHQLCKDTIEDPEEMAVGLANTAVVISPLIPWSTASATPLSVIGVSPVALFSAFYLYILVLWNLLVSLRKRRLESVGQTN